MEVALSLEKLNFEKLRHLWKVRWEQALLPMPEQLSAVCRGVSEWLMRVEGYTVPLRASATPAKACKAWLHGFEREHPSR